MIGKCMKCSHVHTTEDYDMLFCDSKEKTFNRTFCRTYHECFEPKEAHGDVL